MAPSRVGAGALHLAREVGGLLPHEPPVLETGGSVQHHAPGVRRVEREQLESATIAPSE